MFEGKPTGQNVVSEGKPTGQNVVSEGKPTGQNVVSEGNRYLVNRFKVTLYRPSDHIQLVYKSCRETICVKSQMPKLQISIRIQKQNVN